MHLYKKLSSEMVFLFVISVIFSIPTIYSTNMIVGYIWAGTYFLMLLVLLFTRRYLVIPCAIPFLFNSIEFSTYLLNSPEIYTPITIDIYGIPFHLLVMLLSMASLGRSIFTAFNYRKFKMVVYLPFLLLGYSFIIFAINSIFYDLSLYQFSSSFLISKFFYILYPFFWYYIFIAYISECDCGYRILELVLIRSIFIVMISSIIVNLFNTSGYYGDYNYFISPVLIFYVPLFLILNCSDLIKSELRLVLLFLLIAAVLFMDLYGGKVFLSILIVFIYYLYRQKQKAVYIMPLLIVMFPLLMIAYPFLNLEVMWFSKLKEVQSLIYAIIKLDTSVLEPSVFFRLSEVINVVHSWNYNPISMLFGVGVLGGVNDYIGYYQSYVSGAFSHMEYKYGFFVSLHEGVLFLNRFGLAGVLIVILIAVTNLQKSNKNQLFYRILGLSWLVLFISYSINLALFGALILSLGLSEDKRVIG